MNSEYETLSIGQRREGSRLVSANKLMKLGAKTGKNPVPVDEVRGELKF